MLNKTEVKYIQSLTDKKSRAEHGVFIAEGPKIIADLLNDHAGEIVCLYATKDWLNKNQQKTGTTSVKTAELYELEKISALATPQQVLAVVKMPESVFVPFKQGAWLLMLDGLQDPGNMGSIIRIADWFGINTIYCTPDTVDIYNPKVVQAAMGSLLRVRVCYGDCNEWLDGCTIPVYATLLQGTNIFTLSAPQPGIVIIGNEGKGIRAGLLSNGTTALTIPRTGKAESLNAAVAAGIILGCLVNAH